MTDTDHAEALGALNKATAERDRARDLAARLLELNSALEQAGRMTKDDIEELVAQAIAWTEGTDDWYEPDTRYYDTAAEFVDAKYAMDNR